MIAGHNYRSHFGPIRDLESGDPVTFTDVEGTVYAYTVAEAEVLPPTAIGEMVEAGWDLTLFTCTTGEGVSDCTIEVLSWEEGAWQTVAEGGFSAGTAGERRLGIVLSGEKITVNIQDGGAQYSYAPRLEGVDRGNDSGMLWAWLEEPQALTLGERTPLYLEVYDSGDGLRSAALPDSFFDVAYLNQYDRAYAVAVTLEG